MTITPAAKAIAIGAAWDKSYLQPLCYPYQDPIYNFFTERDGQHHTIRVMDSGRQIGKTHTAIVAACEYAQKHPESRQAYAAPTYTWLERFVEPNLVSVLATCPDYLKPDVAWHKGRVRFTNGSIIQFGHVNQDGGKSFRIPSVNIFWIDEAGYVEQLDQFVRSVVLPTFLRTHGRLVVFSTPPPTPGHHFATMVLEARAAGACLEMTIDDNPTITPARRAEIARECGGEQSVEFRREYLGHIVVDASKAIVPEWIDAEARLVQQVPAPDEHVKRQTTVDFGYSVRNAFGALYTYYDFKAARVCVQEETLLVGKATDQLAAAVEATEVRLWADVRPWKRLADADGTFQADMRRQHGLLFSLCQKDTLEAMVNNMRLWIARGRVVIDPRCKQLIRQLQTGIWNDNRTEWLHPRQGGHFDLLACLMYLLRTVPEEVNPYPPEWTTKSYVTHVLPPRTPIQDDPLNALVPRFRGLR